MSNGNLLNSNDNLLMADLAPVQSAHPMDSSRVLLGLMQLSRQAELSNSTEECSFHNVISKPVLRRLLSALHFRDVSTVRHSRRVALLAIGIAQFLGWENRHLKVLEVAGLLHDVGKIGVPDNILFKPGKLSPDEINLMALHHNIAIDVLQACRVDREVLEIVSQSQNHYNGATDNYRLIGGEVHQGARILAVADAYDSLSSEQVYRAAKPHKEIMKILTDAAGTQFDGSIVSALARWFQHDGKSFLNDASQFTDAALAKGPADPVDTLQASSMCHIFSYLYFLESLYDGFYIVDSDLNIKVWNRGVEQMLGHCSHEMIQRQWSGKLLKYATAYDDPMPESQCPLPEVLETGKPLIRELKVQHRDSSDMVSSRWVRVETQCIPLLDNDGHLQGIVEIFRDLSRNSRKSQQYRDLMLAASRDPLTSVANRGELETQLAMMLSEYKSRSAPEPFSVIFLDVDHFKKINDTYGHSVGDKVLVHVSRMLQHETYSGELVSRYGGEEFVLLCPETDLPTAVKRAERLRTMLSSSKIDGQPGVRITASFGVSEVEPGDSIESVLRRADKALYMAKETGRNKTCSLTTEECSSVGVNENETSVDNERLVFRTQIKAFMAADMVVYKLGGFVDENRAKLLEVTPSRAVMRVGHRGLLPFWGSTDHRRPVEMSLEFDQPSSKSRAAGNNGAKVTVSVCIRPVGRVRKNGDFEARALRLIKELRSHFLAE